jgi:hypothetical protein
MHGSGKRHTPTVLDQMGGYLLLWLARCAMCSVSDDDPMKPRYAVQRFLDGIGDSDVVVFDPAIDVWHVIESAEADLVTQAVLDLNKLTPTYMRTVLMETVDACNVLMYG